LFQDLDLCLAIAALTKWDVVVNYPLWNLLQLCDEIHTSGLLMRESLAKVLLFFSHYMKHPASSFPWWERR
jgi:hypothetical protein